MNRRFLLSLVFLFLAGCTNRNNDSVSPQADPLSDHFVSPTVEIPEDVVQGMVMSDQNDPIPDAIVRLQATDNFTRSDADGFFRLNAINLEFPVSITAWGEGYYINNATASLEEQTITIILDGIAEEDNKNYAWLTSFNAAGEGEDQGCAECHAGYDSEPSIMLPVEEWLLDAHSQSAINPRFLTIYNGTDTKGNQSPETIFIPAQPYNRNSSGYNYIALAPDLTIPYYGPGYKLDFPESAGNCGTCHVPGEAAKPGKGFATDPNQIHGVEREGVFCDLCHKVWDVTLEDGSNLPYPDFPGVLSFEFRRPGDGHQFFSGPLDDVAPGEDTFTPIQKESAFCAPCHFGVFWEQPIYNSYGEWLDSPYSDPETGQTCQDCHMPHSGATIFALPGVGAHQRDPETIFSHLMPGAMDLELLQNAVSLNAWSEIINETIQIQVEIKNDNTGHKIPTDYPGRQLILIVQGFDEHGNPLRLIEGPSLPEWAGIGNPEFGYYAGLPGLIFANILEEVWTGISPTVAYWNPFTIVSDNRIDPFQTDLSKYVFYSPNVEETRIEIQLLLRRTFIEIRDWKQWDIPDITVDKITLVIGN